MVKAFIAAAVCCATLGLVGTAAADNPPEGQALFPETVPGAGLTGVAGAQATIRRVLRGGGSTATAAFEVGTKKVVFVDAARKLRFRAVYVRSVRFGTNAAELTGLGVVNGRRVGFTAVAVHNALPGVDVFRIAWNHGASLGGRVVDGSVFIR